MQLWDKLAEYAKNFSSYRTTMDFGDVAEILIIAVLLYYTLVWMKTTRAWILLKGLIVILAFLLLAYFSGCQRYCGWRRMCWGLR